MSPTQPRSRLPLAERRALIVEAAGRLFGEHGFDATRLDAVAAAAGVTKPIVYRHFGSKRDLYLALLDRHGDDLSGFVAAIPETGTLEERLRVVLDGWLTYVEQHSYAWKMLFRDTGGGSEIAARRHQVHARARTVLADVIDSLAASPPPRPQLEPLAELTSMGMAALVLWWLEEPAVSREAVLEALTTVWVKLLN
ncbi:MAG TPA: TetR/AcrR family transcriptional regulator [Solirubrobacterales bacterium]|nr:TetR/AcrR family transcriptional regulator [Solirubrobacterales bacterium]